MKISVKIKRTKGLLVACLFVGLTMLFSSSTVLASGKQVFIAKCGSCHGTGKEAPAVNPSKFAGVQWKGFFKRNKHQRKKDISGVVSSADQDVILAYLVKSAADGDQPEAAAIP